MPGYGLDVTKTHHGYSIDTDLTKLKCQIQYNLDTLPTLKYLGIKDSGYFRASWIISMAENRSGSQISWSSVPVPASFSNMYMFLDVGNDQGNFHFNLLLWLNLSCYFSLHWFTCEKEIKEINYSSCTQNSRVSVTSGLSMYE